MVKRLRKQKGNPKIQNRGQKKKIAQRKYLHPNQVVDERFRKQYDKSKSFLANAASTNLKELYYDVLPKKKDIPKALHLPKLNEDESRIMKALIAKHGEDYTNMARDIKVNVFQWTVAKCEKFAKLQEEELRERARLQFPGNLGA
eukprot:GEMP01120495.1.p1 GENE.GEMP01120495.1~~GEMP01120495.1.p1  ORF type:complete len:145 (+),score=33.76 GEMP01120495.1:61-495(+)